MRVDIETTYEGSYVSRPVGIRIKGSAVVAGMLVIYQGGGCSRF